MSRARPLGEPGAIEYPFDYDVHPAWIDNYIDETGMEPPSRWRITIDLVGDAQDADTRRRFRRGWDAYQTIEGYPVLPEPVEEPLQFLEYLELWITTHGSSDAGPNGAEGALGFEHEMDSWIAEHGSARLKRARERDYKATRLYALERAKLELPGAWIDTGGVADLRERTDPSEEALDFEELVQARLNALAIPLRARIMWVASPPRDAEEAAAAGEIDYFSEEEAIVVHDYLGRYRAILAVDADYRKDVSA